MSHYVIVGAVIVLALCIAFALWIVLTRPRMPRDPWLNEPRVHTPDPQDPPFFFIPLALLIIFGAYALVQAPEPVTTLANVNEIVIDLDQQCPPAGPQHTDVLSITVNVGQDGTAELMTCARMLKRPYQQRMRWTRQLIVSKE